MESNVNLLGDYFMVELTLTCPGCVDPPAMFSGLLMVELLKG